MTFWLIAAAMTAGIVLVILYPVLFPAGTAARTRAEHDVEVYRAQLSELETDVERGTLSSEEAETARAEIARRLLKADAAAGSGAHKGMAGGRWPVAIAAVMALLVPILSVVAYGFFGAPGLQDYPLSARAAPASAPSGGSDIERLLAAAEARLVETPGDGQGWNVIAPIYLRMGRVDDAIEAFQKAIALLGTNAAREAGLGEALTQKAGGMVTDEARQAFERSLKDNPDYLPSRFFLALDLSQEGRNREAASAWQGLIEASPENAPWMNMARAGLADSREKAGLSPLSESELAANDASGSPEPPRSQSAPGPTAEQMAAASGMNAGDRRAMIEGMVSQLASKLAQNPDDAEGWMRLIRSYSVLGEPKKASDALARALGAMGDNENARSEIAALARSLGVEPTQEGQTP
ncbi:MAG: c-type cytochrome biogenesis protein CcmI [Fulvimarina manganoxydans]|uniref:c-type cytochrome biogenesis protein CcmI n=1 Tax=Fulvimarina manganoxydans TaxID=937218 RepID=UPI00235603E9|nr:c-type cytochrome biogenesis protein CcmI [Fulvimarina manganoxydans]MCK5933425.1 c-type cytochrome biogenesis protein CcmI [Fulvimarina manganoxydans]